MSGQINQKHVKRILIDPGAAVNLMPLYTLLKIGYTQRDLKHENVVVCGFNQNSQRVAGSINLVLSVFGDSQLIVRQVNGIYEVRKSELLTYHQKTEELMSRFAFIKLEHIPRKYNTQADALAKLAAVLRLPDAGIIEITVEERLVLPHVLEIVPQTEEVDANEIDESQGADWRLPFIEYLKYGRLPTEKNKVIELKRRVLSYTFMNDTLYKRSYDQLLLRCLSSQEAKQAMDEVHLGICGAHQAGPRMRLKLKQMGYYWPTMLQDCISMARKCYICQIHVDFIHQHPVPLHPTIPSWPFAAWELTLSGQLTHHHHGVIASY